MHLGFWQQVLSELLGFKIMANAEGDELEIGDGGFVGWTAELIPDAKERCLISCVAVERLAGLVHGT